MKKKMIIILITLFLIYGCQTEEEINELKEKQRVIEIEKEVNKNTEIPNETKEWIIDNKAKKVLTILCMKTSNRCEEIKKNIEEFNKTIKTYYIELDNLEEEVKNIYKKTYELKNYTGYLPYVFIVDQDKLIKSKEKINSIEEINELINN